MSSVNKIRIANKTIGAGEPVFVIAEAGVNHNGDLRTAKKLVDAAAEAGADAVKFQTFRAQELVSASTPKAKYQEQGTSAGESQFEMIRKLELSDSAHAELVERCKEKGIIFLSTAFDAESADLLESFSMPAYKVPSGEITNWPFLEHLASKNKPIILSTGMSDLGEVEDAVKVLRSANCAGLVILHCTSSYPTPPESVNLRAMQTIADNFQTPVGLSDHTMGIEIAFAATALGASVIEKHFTIDRSLPGPDHKASLEPGELRSLVQGIRKVEAALGDGKKRAAQVEEDVKNVARRSIVARVPISKGTRITTEMLAFKRPGTGIPPSQLAQVIGRNAKRMISADSLILLADLE